MTYARWWWCQLFFYSAPPCSSVHIMGHDLACIAYKIGWLLLVLWLYANRNIWACPGQWAYSRLVCGYFSVCVCVSFSAFMHIMWMHVYVCCWPSMLCRLLLLSDLNRALGEVRMSTSLCLPPLTHTIRPEWISFAVSDRWTTRLSAGQVTSHYHQWKKCIKQAFTASHNIPEHSLFTKEQTHLLLFSGREKD